MSATTCGHRGGACGCCAGSDLATPRSLVNPPGRAALDYRIGTQAAFLETMRARLREQPALAALTTRSSADASIALLDAWACVLDVLTFYQERIANEGFLRTAGERQSLVELARAIGYQAAPGVAASTHLVFTLEDAPGAARAAPGPSFTACTWRKSQRSLPRSRARSAPTNSRASPG